MIRDKQRRESIRSSNPLFLLSADCGTPADPTDGMVSTPDGTSVGKFAMYACDDGYVLSGTSIRVCQGDGMWSPLPPTCSLVGKYNISYLQN